MLFKPEAQLLVTPGIDCTRVERLMLPIVVIHIPQCGFFAYHVRSALFCEYGNTAIPIIPELS